MKMNDLKEIMKGTFLVVFGVGFLIIFYKIAKYGYHIALEPNPYILSVEMLAAGIAILLGFETLWKVGAELSKQLSKRLRN